MNQTNHRRIARWVTVFGSILEIDRNRTLPGKRRSKSRQKNTRTQQEKAHD